MVLLRCASFLLVALGLYLGRSPDTIEAASCPAFRITATDVCKDVERNDVKVSPNLTHVVCDNLQNLSQLNSSEILRAFQFVLRRNEIAPLAVVKVLVNQVDAEELETALEELNRMILNSSLISNAWKTTVLRALWDEKLRNENRFNETAFVASWFQGRLRPFISVISADMLRCLRNETIQCAQYQAIIKGLDLEFTQMSSKTQEEVLNSFQLPYLEGLDSNGSACTEGLNSTAWLTANFRRFGQYAKYQQFVFLNSKFNGLDALKYLTVKHLGQLSAMAGALKTPRDVQNLLEFVEPAKLTEYMDEFSREANASLPKVIQASLLEHILPAVQPTLQNASEVEFVQWMEHRLSTLISGLNRTLVPLLLVHLETRNCSTIRATTALLNSSIGEFSNATRQGIYEGLLHLLSNTSLRCYSPNSSFAMFLRETFQGFVDLLTLKDLESLIPAADLPKIINTISPDALADLFSKDGFLNQDPFLTVVLKIYRRNGAFMDGFNQKDIIAALSNGTKTALLAGVWFTVVTSSNDTEVDAWLGGRLTNYFMFLNGDTLNASETQSASCVTFEKIVNKLSDNIGMFKTGEEEVYYSIKAYLAATKTKPRCYNASDPETSDWFVMYFGNYIRYSSARDIRQLIDYKTDVFQDLAINPYNLELISQVTLQKDLAEMYAAALFSVDSDFYLDSIPDQLICFARRSTLISTLSPAETLNLTARVNQHCSSTKPSVSDRQLAIMLVAQIKILDGPALIALGQQAMGLSLGQISNLKAQDLVDPKVLESLGRVNGWNRGQSQGLVNKILRTNFTLDSADKFERLGTLVQGLPSNGFERILADSAIRLAKHPGFLSALKPGPDYLKKAFIRKILSNSSSLNDILDNVPDDWIDQVPISQLMFRDKISDLRKMSTKQWSPQQAAVFFGDVLAATDNYTELSASILQGFQCSAASRLMPGQLSFLVKEVKIKNAYLNDEQLSCMAKLLTRSNLTTNITGYPPDVLLFFPLAKVDNDSCGTFYALTSQGNLSLLANGSVQRTKLLENTLSCLGLRNTSLSKEHLRKLGAFVCDMDPSAIGDSDPEVLENLKLCPDLSASQRIALNILLSDGRTPYGPPEFWDVRSLEDLGPLAFYINRTTWDSINKEERMIFFRNVADTFDGQSASQREKIVLFIRSVGSKPSSSPRTKRATETCQSSPITASALEDWTLLIHYDTAQQFDACLSNEVLKSNLASLLEQPLPNDYLAVVKRKLDEIYPDGVPEDQLTLLDYLSRLYSTDEIGKWNVTSSDTLAALLNPENGVWKPAELRRLVARYMELGGVLTGSLLDTLKYICILDEDQLKQISPDSIRNAETLDLSSCPQGKKDILYTKARASFASQEGTGAYYPLIRPYLGGAPVEDLKKLAGSQVAMDIKTFTNLKPEELEKLSIPDVKGLLGVNLPDLKEVENHPSVALWIKSHYQSELDTLGIGLRGGMSTPPSTSVSSLTMDPPRVIEHRGASRADIPIPTSAMSNTTLSDNTTNLSSNVTIMRVSPTISVPATGSRTTHLFKITVGANSTSNAVDVTNKTSAVVPEVALPTKATVASPGITAASIDTISGITGLATVNVINETTPVKANVTHAIVPEVALPTKTIAASPGITDASIDTISGITGLDTVNVINETTPVKANVTHAIVPEVAHPTKATVASPGITAASIDTISGITGLATVNIINETTPVKANVTHAIVPEVALPTKTTATSPGITAASVDTISGITGLDTVNVINETTPVKANVTHAIVPEVALPTKATVASPGITDASIDTISGITGLDTVNVINETTPVKANVTHAIVPEVALPTKATVASPGITDASIDTISGITGLDTVNVINETTPVKANVTHAIVPEVALPTQTTATSPGITAASIDTISGITGLAIVNIINETTPVKANVTHAIVPEVALPTKATVASPGITAASIDTTSGITGLDTVNVINETTPVKANVTHAIVPEVALPTKATVASPGITAASIDTISGITGLATVNVINETTPVKANVTHAIVPEVALPTKTIAASPGITAASIDNNTNGITGLATAKGINVTTPVETKAVSSTTATNDTNLSTTAMALATNASISHHMPAIQPNHSFTPNATTTSTMPNVSIAAISERHPAPPKPTPSVTIPASISPATKMTSNPPMTTSKTTVRVPETPHRTTAPPGLGPSRTTTLAATTTKTVTRRTPPQTKPPPRATPNGYINIQPLGASACNPTLSWLLLVLPLTVGISSVKSLL